MNWIKTLALDDKNRAASTGRHWCGDGALITHDAISPIDGARIASWQGAAGAEIKTVLSAAERAFHSWRLVPAPRRGEIVRRIGERAQVLKQELASCVTAETGKTFSESLGEVQELIDICFFAQGLSRQLHGHTMPSERPEHRLFEQYHPLGPVGVITAFNFPVAVWAWNAMIAAVCGDPVVWKPSPQATLSAIAVQRMLGDVIKECGVPEGVFCLVCGGAEVGKKLAEDRRLPLVSFTGSSAAGRAVAQVVAGRLGKTILELGGNNAAIVTPDADLESALPAIVFGAAGTSGQRCTTLRRLIVHESLFDGLAKKTTRAYEKLLIGDPRQEGVRVGPLVSQAAVERMQEALRKVTAEGGKILYGGEVLTGGLFASGCYARPALVAAQNDFPTVQTETFAPILYLIPYRGGVENAISLHNAAAHGLTSAIFTRDIREMETFLSAVGSDCGIANVNISTSGAEIGGAFGGEKDSGGGREAGSDAWKAYMRRQTVTVSYAEKPELAQGVEFEV